MKVDAIKEHRKKYLKYYESGVLNADAHYRLVEDIDNIAAKANILPRCIYTSMNTKCSDEEIAWVRGFRSHLDKETAGLAYIGAMDAITDRMMLIAGACIRNYIDARLYTVQEILESIKNQELEQPRVMLIPNFYISKEAGGGIPSWMVSQLLGLLMNRYTSGLQTVLYIQNIDTMAAEYGPQLKSIIRDHYTLIS